MNHLLHPELLSVTLDGGNLTPELLVALGYRASTRITISDDAWARVGAARRVVDEIVESGITKYGINTGFGKFATTIIAPQDLSKLQVNLIRSHCAGVGDVLSPPRARILMVLRINVLARGNSGIRPETLEQIVAAYNAGVIAYIPEIGTVGASGDLAPMSHLALGLMGEGMLATLDNPTWRPALQVLNELRLKAIELKAKEGLAMINSSAFITGLGCEALVRGNNAARTADIVCALTIEALMGTKVAMNPRVHAARGHLGQIQSAARIRALLDSERFPSAVSRSHKNCNKVQDAYSMRCAPQVHGIVVETVRWVDDHLKRECNASTDNPLIFADAPTLDERIISGGNFHGEYPAKALDFLTIAVHELGSISERRIERLTNPALSHLPAFLTQNGGLQSGQMITHCTAASLVSENKCMCHPASVDSISTSAAQEDHCSYGGFAARKALKVVENVERVLAIELMCASFGIDFHRPLKTTEPLEKVLAKVREVCPPWTDDRVPSGDMERVHQLIRTGVVWDTIRPYLPHELWTCLGGINTVRVSHL